MMKSFRDLIKCFSDITIIKQMLIFDELYSILIFIDCIPLKLSLSHLNVLSITK